MLSAAWAWTPGLNNLRYASWGLYPLFSVGMYSLSCSTPSCSSTFVIWIHKIKTSSGMSCIIHISSMDGLSQRWSVSITPGIRTRSFLCWTPNAFPTKAKILVGFCLLLNICNHFQSISHPPPWFLQWGSFSVRHPLFSLLHLPPQPGNTQKQVCFTELSTSLLSYLYNLLCLPALVRWGPGSLYIN